jgi:hypothetical protein
MAVFVMGCRQVGISNDPPMARADGLKWVELTTTKQFSHESTMVVDIESRLPHKHPCRDEDLVTWVHEGTHYLNSRVGEEHGRPGFYLTEGRAVLLEQPDLTLKQIADYIPEHDRRTIYDTYLVKQRQWWDDRPLYLLDEWVAYGNGTACRKSLNKTGKERIDTVRFALEMEVYVRYMARLAAKDPEYQGIDDLNNFIEWHSKRVRYLAGPEDIALATEEMLRK